MKKWRLQSAKAQLNQLIQQAAQGPQQMQEDYDKLPQKNTSFVDFIRQSPLLGMNIKSEHDKSLTRGIDL